jgi:spermidine synthase
MTDLTHMLHVGLGGGTIPRFIHRHWPDVRQTVVELSPEVIDVAYRFFDLPSSHRLEVIAGDGAQFLSRGTRRFDAIYLDAYHAEGASPEVQNIDTLLAARGRLNTAGWLFCNAWGSHQESLRRLTRQLREIFPVLYAISVRQDSNVIFFGSVDAQLPPPHALMTRAKGLAQRIPVDFPDVVRRLKPVAATSERLQQH